MAGHSSGGIAASHRAGCRAAILALGLAIAAAPRASAQPATVSVQQGNLHVRAPGFRFVRGEALDRLKNGRAVRVELSLDVLDGRGGRTLAQARRSFDVSYDLWEERFAIVTAGTPGPSASHMTQQDAERWCLEQLMVPDGALTAVDPAAPFWIRIAYHVIDDEPSDGEDDATFTLRALIDRLSRRRPPGVLEGSMEAGPFRLRD